MRVSNAGFVLPTVVMVSLVVVLLTTAILFRSTDRAKNASNVRVNQRVLAATAPAVDRAQAKIKKLLADPTLPRSTPTDQALYQAMKGSLPKYTLGDELPLKLVYDINNDGIKSLDAGTATSLDQDDTLVTGWKFPVDTDNNGKFDSYSLYGIYFRNPPQGTNLRSRSPIESRTTPMDNASSNSGCGAGTAASLVGSSGWYKTSDGNLKKSFFVIATTVPITTSQTDPLYETYKGNKGFAALEFQQDQARIPLSNNAVVYEDDLEITPGPGIKLNGRIMTNGNFMVGEDREPVKFFQVSSINSCFYAKENAKITVGGNVMIGSPDSTKELAPAEIHLFRQGARPTPRNLNTGNGSVNNANDTAVKASYNSDAYAQRIDYLVQNTAPTQLPPEVVQKGAATGNTAKALEDYYRDRTRRVPYAEVSADATSTQALAGAAAPAPAGTDEMRPPAAWMYPATLDNATSTNSLQIRKNQPPARDPDILTTDEEEIGDRILVGNGLPGKWWDPEAERFIDFYDQQPQFVDGSANQTTNWNPATNSKRTRMTQVLPLSDLGNTDRDGFWERKAAEPPVQQLDAVGGLRVVTGAGIYSPVNSFLPRPTSPIPNDPSTAEDESKVDLVATPALLEGFPVVLPDSMPMWEDRTPNTIVGGLPLPTPDGIPQLSPDTLPVDLSANTDKRGDLVMRATAVYHYRSSGYPNPNPLTDPYPHPTNPYQTPIACVSSFYDPSTPATALNRVGLPNISLRSGATPNRDLTGLPTVALGAGGRSHNGISYLPGTTSAGVTGISAANADGLFAVTDATLAANPAEPTATLPDRLSYQANLIYPNGRFVNEQLRKALTRIASNGKLSLAEQAALDSTLCAMQIADGTLTTPDETAVPHGAIYETAFLDARQVKAVESEAPWATVYPRTPVPKADYDLSIEERQPLEIRATVVDLDLLRRKENAGTANTAVPGPEYLLPDSGIIYASRDDAQRDMSVDPNALTGTDVQRMATRNLKSPVDFTTDPTRRPNGIMLINGSTLARGGTAPNNAPNNYKAAEKGLILATNLPLYIQGDANNANNPGFNLHQNPSGAILEEFATPNRLVDYSATGAWTTNQFYDRGNGLPNKGRDTNFACRKDQPGLNCNPGDLWRSATVLADSVTLVSDNFRFGFRNEGDYDLRKNVENLTNNLALGYDFNGSGTIEADDPLTPAPAIEGIITGPTSVETLLGIDLNGDGDTIDASPAATLPPATGPSNVTDDVVTEANVTATAARKLNGFFDNDYLTSADWVDPATGYPKDFDTVTAAAQGSSYVNNYVTPIQRRTSFPEYVMEICRKPLVSQCGPNDWVVNINGSTTDVKASTLLGTPTPTPVAQLLGTAPVGTTPGTPGAGTTARVPLDPAQQRYPRRVAFQRNTSNNQLVLGTNNRPIPLGINAGGTVQAYAYNTAPPPAPAGLKALWFRTTSSTTDPTNFATRNYGNAANRPLFYTQPLSPGTIQQPLLVPVLQLQMPTGDSAANLAELTLPASENVQSAPWLQRPIDDTTFNLILVAGDTPSRDASTNNGTPSESNGGVQNLPVFLEDWGEDTDKKSAQMNGSFIQFKRSAYATAPFLAVLPSPPPLGGIFNYLQTYRTPTSNPAGRQPPEGRSPSYVPPNRQWGYDVGLLSQQPDLFSQQITTPSAGDPNEFYRELSRDDDWVKTLLCAAQMTAAGTPPVGTTPGTPPAYGVYAIEDQDQRPVGCEPPV